MCTRLHTYELTSWLRLVAFNLLRIRETARIRRAVTQTIYLYIEIREVLRFLTELRKGWRTSLSHSLMERNGKMEGSHARASERASKQARERERERENWYGISNRNVSKPAMWKRSVSGVYVRPASASYTGMMIRASLLRRLQTHQPIRHDHELRGSFHS